MEITLNISESNNKQKCKTLEKCKTLRPEMQEFL